MQHQQQMAVIMGLASVLESTDKNGLIKDLLNLIPEGKLEQIIDNQNLTNDVEKVVVVHIGYPSHVSGYLISQYVVNDILQMADPDCINDHIIDSGIAIQSTESDVFFDMLSRDVHELHSQLKSICS